MTHPEASDIRQQMQLALDQMTGALRILDELGAPGEIGSHLDLAIARLEDRLGLDHQPAASVDMLLFRLGAEAHATDEGLMERNDARGIAPA